jgi:adenylate kinase family enzyme
LGPPGSFRAENAMFIAQEQGWQCINTGELLKKEVSKKSEIGKRIQECNKNYHYGKFKFKRQLLI